MKVVVNDENNMIIYINNLHIDKVIFNDKEELEKYFQQLFNRLKKFYRINIRGYYDIKVYIDNFYGLVIQIKRDNIEYCDYFGNQVDMRITIENNDSFLYQINDIFSIDQKIFKKVCIIRYKDNFYLKINKPLNDIELAMLIENSTIIYDSEVNIVLKKGKVLNVFI